MIIVTVLLSIVIVCACAAYAAYIGTRTALNDTVLDVPYVHAYHPVVLCAPSISIPSALPVVTQHSSVSMPSTTHEYIGTLSVHAAHGHLAIETYMPTVIGMRKQLGLASKHGMTRFYIDCVVTQEDRSRTYKKVKQARGLYHGQANNKWALA